MTDANATSPTLGPDDRLPSMPFSRRALFADPQARPTGPSTRSSTAVSLDERLRVVGLLFVKMEELDNAAYKLNVIPRDSLTFGQLQQITAQVKEARNEHALCDARREEVDNGGPFKPLPAGAEAGLMAAITAVDAHTGGAAALTGLLQAVHGLVAAYGGKDV